jgi:hypothetical protein
MNFEEFLPKETQEVESEVVVEAVEEFFETDETQSIDDDLDVQKAVVESLAADKAAQDEVIASLRKDNYALRNEILLLQSKIAEQSKLLENVGELLAKNSEGSLSSKIALLERCEQLPDRFEGESRDHVIEVIKAAREQAEKDGRLRLAQILEGVLVNNEPSGNLVERRENLKQLFIDNGHIISGPVINELDKLGISYKNGEEYLLTSEIIIRNY